MCLSRWRVFCVFAGCFGGAASGQYTIRTFAGGGPPDGLPATGIGIAAGALASDSAGNLYAADRLQQRVFRIGADGRVTTVAGNGGYGTSGDGIPARSTPLQDPMGVAVDGAGNVYIAEYTSRRIRRVSSDGLITTVAGNGSSIEAGDGGPAVSAGIGFPGGIALDSSGNLYIGSDHYIRKVSAVNGVITTVAGNGRAGFQGDGGPATSASMSRPIGMVVDDAGNLFFVDYLNVRVRKVSASGILSTVYAAGSGTALSVDRAGNVYAGVGGKIRKVSAEGVVSTVAGNGIAGFSGDGGPAAGAQISAIASAWPSGAGSIYIIDGARIRKVSSDGIINTIAGNGSASFSGDGGPATGAQLGLTKGVAVGGSGFVYVADTLNHRVRRVSQDGTITTIAGNGSSGFSGDGGPATAASLSYPRGLAVDNAGNLYICDYETSAIRKVTPDGNITTVAGGPNARDSSDGGAAANARLSTPEGLAVDQAGNLYIAERGGNRIRKVSPQGIITTAAGNGRAGFSGDGGLATSAQLSSPRSVAVDNSGSLYIADEGNHRVRIVLPSGVIATVAGNGELLSSAEVMPATNASLDPWAVALDGAGHLFIADLINSRIFRLSSDTVISSIAGGVKGYAGDGGPSANAWMSGPWALAVDNKGNIYVADANNNRIRILEQVFSVQPTELTFTAKPGDSLPISQLITVTGAQGGIAASVGYNQSWLSVFPVGPSSSPAEFTVTVNPLGQSAGIHTSSVNVFASNTYAAIPVTLNVSPACTTGLSPSSYSALAAGSTTSFTVNASAGCFWTAVGNVSWITITSGGSGSGSGTLTFQTAPNLGPARTGTINISGGLTFTVTQAAPSGPLPGLRFQPVPPCRIADTRNSTGPFGGPAMTAHTTRSFTLPASNCGIPGSASAYSLNVTVVPFHTLSYLTLWPTGQPQPLVSTLNSFDGRIKANAAIVPAGVNGAISVFVTDDTTVVLDINGYFVASVDSGSSFYPAPPCRVADTRLATGPLGGPSMAAGPWRTFPVPSSNCGVPATAQAYSLNVTAIPSGPFGYLTAWPAGSTQPFVSTLNAPTGTVTANAAIVPAGTNGGISLSATNPTDLVLDINGYFGPPGGSAALSFYPVTPCRISDTRLANGAFGGPALSAGATRSYPVPASACGIPSTARAYSLNVTVVPKGPLSYLTLWPSDVARPLVSTLNSFDGSVVSNAAVVPASAGGAISVYVTNPAHVILDINGYFQ